MSLRDFLFYEESGITLYCGDCRDVMPLLGAPIDMVLSDPPYGIAYTSTHNSHRTGAWARWVRDENFAGIAGDDEAFDPRPLLIAPRVALFGGNYFAGALPDSRCWITWDKRAGIGSNDFADCELIWTNFARPSRIFRHVWSGLIRGGEENVACAPKQHPHQKPMALVRYLMDYGHCPSGGLVLDPYCGSGPTLQAAKETGRRAIGIEIEPRYCEIAVKRLRQEVLALEEDW
jgi:DNA modification methylase